MSSQFLQENAVGNMVKGRQHVQPFPDPLSRSKFSVLLRLQRHHKEHIFYISYHHLGGILEVLVPHAVDEGVHCWRNQRVQNSHHQIQGWRGDGAGPQIGKHASAQKQGDHSQGIGHVFGHRGGDGAQVKEGEVEEEEVHRGVEAVVAGYGGDDEAIAQESSQVDAQEEPEVQELQLPRVCKCQEEELGDGAAVGHLLSLWKGPGQGGKGSDK
ncbi:hypothetical protein QYF61_003442 [Mycteria americana]|uniref:Uncharacterized protein n=1 Tax=Mycteria americana TaxID=33587 RepID=A0AAN7MWI8_MYCAM|nr:hypothetical protein QYF61_003442 [Mycteria americana]